MAKNTRSRPLPSEHTHPSIELTKHAIDAASAPMVSQYANYLQLNLNDNEIFIDFFRFEPSPRNDGIPVSTLVQRIIVPVGLGKGFANAVANIVAHYEKVTGKILPNQRAPHPDDTMDIWK